MFNPLPMLYTTLAPKRHRVWIGQRLRGPQSASPNTNFVIDSTMNPLLAEFIRGGSDSGFWLMASYPEEYQGRSPSPVS